jgi:hypothetical protein
MDDKVDNKSSRPMRGGAFNHPPLNLRTALHAGRAPAGYNGDVGFRPARTFH